MDRLPTELLYEIVAKLSTDHDALAALRATNRRYRDVVFSGSSKPMLVATIGELLPEAMALHKLPYLSKSERFHVRDWFLRWFRYRAVSTTDQKDYHYTKPLITIPTASEVDDVAISRLSVRESLHLVDFHQKWVMSQAKKAVQIYQNRKALHARRRPGTVFAEVSLDEETRAAAAATYRAEHYIRALACAASLDDDGDDEHSRYFKDCVGLDMHGIRMYQPQMLLDFQQVPQRGTRSVTGFGNGGNWPCNLLMSDSKMLIISTP
ncbi:hypothetical protein CC79DRAFT_477711 [Sarocladium strictum]